MIRLEIVRISWDCPEDEFVLLSVLSLLRKKKLIGEKNSYGGEDEIMLFSGGPISSNSKQSVIAGPPIKRYVARQPDRNTIPKNQNEISPISGQIELEQNTSSLVWLEQAWSNNSGWDKVGEISAESIENFGIKITSNSPKLTKAQLKSEGFLPGQYCVAFAYDLVQWTQPWQLFHPPEEETVLGVVWEINRWIVHNRESCELELVGIKGDDWFRESSKVINDTLSNYKQQFSWPSEKQKNLNQNERSNHTDLSHQMIVELVKKAIKAGELYQLNFGRKWFGKLNETPWEIMLRLLLKNPAPWSNWIYVPDLKLAICSSSPELLLSAKSGRVTTRPIKGTTPRGKTEYEDKNNIRNLITSVKERAEHLMLVDLERNDLSMVCIPGTVRRSEFQIESYADVHHLVSEIEGNMRCDVNVWSTIQAIFPGGSITGCPKTVTIASIDELEKEPRSFWTGSIGYVDSRRNLAQLNILIRTLEATNQKERGWFATVQAGGGLVIDSNSESEVEEAKWKAAALRIAAGWINKEDNLESSPNELEIKKINIENELYEKSKEQGIISIWPNITSKNKKKVLFVDNLDSFSWNIIHALSELGSDVCVINGREKNIHTLDEILRTFRPSHIIIGPGPGKPGYSKLTMQLAKRGVDDKLRNEVNTSIPLLGVCLGHQAIGVVSGLELIENPKGAIHGVPRQILHDCEGLFGEMKQNVKMTRYHSLILVNENENSNLKITARDTKDESIMALEHNNLPIFGVQFHPESAESEEGYEIFKKFLDY